MIGKLTIYHTDPHGISQATFAFIVGDVSAVVDKASTSDVDGARAEAVAGLKSRTTDPRAPSGTRRRRDSSNSDDDIPVKPRRGSTLTLPRTSSHRSSKSFRSPHVSYHSGPSSNGLSVS